MTCIMSISVAPGILQLNNSSEFLGRCIAYIKLYFPTVNIVKGKPWRPQPQGSIEKGDGPFKSIGEVDGGEPRCRVVFGWHLCGKCTDKYTAYR